MINSSHVPAGVKRVVQAPTTMPEKMQAFGIRSGPPAGWQRLFMSHPPLEERIAALNSAR